MPTSRVSPFVFRAPDHDLVDETRDFAAFWLNGNPDATWTHEFHEQWSVKAPCPAVVGSRIRFVPDEATATCHILLNVTPLMGTLHGPDQLTAPAFLKTYVELCIEATNAALQEREDKAADDARARAANIEMRRARLAAS